MLPPTNKYSARPLPQFSRRHVCPLRSHILLAQKPSKPTSEARKAQKLQWPFESSTDDLHCFCWSPGWPWPQTQKKHTRMVLEVPATGKCHLKETFPNHMFVLVWGLRVMGFLVFLHVAKRCQSTAWFQKMFVNGWTSTTQQIFAPEF